ncbi:MAG: hypothetical protein BGO01_16430 [Armatimonadetes bacterium 55-13]|nr:MAG: hypothetical protein BGO01_16430 [Armatimonadetes bacterium 55-13]
MSPLLRLATLDDLAPLEPLMKASIRTLSEGFYDEVQAEAAEQFIAVPDPDVIVDGTYFVVEAEGKLVACGGWSRLQKLFTGTTDQEDLPGGKLDPAVDSARIRAMFVHPDFARLGFGKLIYEACERAARECGFLSLELMATLPGVPFYRRLGFLDVEKADLILPNGVVLPCLKMRKVLG